MAFTGRITALDSVINEQTRNIQVQAIVTNKENKLRPGMFVQVELPLGQSTRSSATAGLRDQLRALWRFGFRRDRYEGSEGNTLQRASGSRS